MAQKNCKESRWERGSVSLTQEQKASLKRAMERPVPKPLPESMRAQIFSEVNAAAADYLLRRKELIAANDHLEGLEAKMLNLLRELRKEFAP